MPRLHVLSLLLVFSTLAACRMPVQVQGQGFVYGSDANAVYEAGYVFDIKSDFSEEFWPVPIPGSAFSAWTDICNTTKGACKLNLNRELWSRDQEVPLGLTFNRNYSGPLTLINYELYWNSSSRTLSIPADSIILDGASPSDSPRFFMADANLNVIIPASRIGNQYFFKLPDTTTLAPNDFWLIASSTDTEGTIASAAISFGLGQQVKAQNLRPHKANSPYANVLANCAAANNPFTLCPFQRLPLLGNDTDKPSITRIMERTVVSHGWMGQRFAEVLKQLPPDMLQMFRGITAVVIAADIRPAFYTPATGAIYLDPQDLWLTPTERNSIDWEPDYRGDYGSEIQFIPAAVYVDEQYVAWQSSYSYPEGVSRSLSEITWPIANLLIHELAHANDATPPSLLHLANAGETPLDFSYRIDFQTPTFNLVNQYPLGSSLLQQIGAVLYQGASASDFINSLTPGEVGVAFESDHASDLYAYSTPYEDTAMLVEEVLTRYYFGLDRVVSFLDVPADPEADCTQYTLRWGERNRVSTPAVKARAELVLAGILDQTDVSRYVDAVPPTEDLQRGIGLCQSLGSLSLSEQSMQGQFLTPNHIGHTLVERAQRQLVTAKKHTSIQGQRNKGRVIQRH